MTTTTQKRLVAGTQIGNSIATHYTVPAGKFATVLKMTLLNTTGSAVTVDLHLVATGDTATAANQILDALSLPANMTSPQEVPAVVAHVLEAGGTIQAVASAAASISLMCSGLEVTI